MCYWYFLTSIRWFFMNLTRHLLQSDKENEPVVSVDFIGGHSLHFIDRGSSWYVFNGHCSHLLLVSYVPAVQAAIFIIYGKEKKKTRNLYIVLCSVILYGKFE